MTGIGIIGAAMTVIAIIITAMAAAIGIMMIITIHLALRLLVRRHVKDIAAAIDERDFDPGRPRAPAMRLRDFRSLWCAARSRIAAARLSRAMQATALWSRTGPAANATSARHAGC